MESRQVQLVGVRLVLSVATRCRGWLLRSAGRLVARTDDASRAGCKVVRYQGSVPVSVVAADGRRVSAGPLHTDADGRAQLSFVAVDRTLRASGHGGLDAFLRLEIGSGGWAGAIDLAELRRLVADRHFEWVRSGRGSAALFVARHPTHSRSGAARALAVEAALARQERDYLAVARGELEAIAFLRRYVRSPFRRSVTTLGDRATTAF